MFEKVNPSHPDKIADRIAGAIVDLAYTVTDQPKVAVEVLIGHGKCSVFIESNIKFVWDQVNDIVQRIAGDVYLDLLVVPQDLHLNHNQQGKIRCGDNGIFKGVPISYEEYKLSKLVRQMYKIYPTDGKYILSKNKLTVCQSNFEGNDHDLFNDFDEVIVNPLGYWTGGINVDSGATNRKLGSDMGRSITGGGLHGKDLSKADVAINIYAFLEAQKTGKVTEFSCSIGDEFVNGIEYKEIVDAAKHYIESIGGFEKLAEWGLL